MSRPRILLLSAYRAASHGAWADWLMRAHPHIEWQSRELPGRHFRWRIRGNPLSWLDQLPEEPPDRILATSMVDLATLRGLHPALARVPAWYYFHENQFAYPLSDRQIQSVEPQIVQIYGALAAQYLVFNSRFNQDSFLDGVDALLRRMPDQVPRGIRERLAARSTVLPVPIDPPAVDAVPDPGLILWNHRWEYDKDPDLFAEALIDLAARGIDFRVALLGWRPQGGCAALERIRATLPDRIVADGRLPDPQYRRILGQAAIAVSTTRHEFQGLALLEAVSAGALPLVPDALCYPEQYPRACRYPPGNREALVERLANWLSGHRPGQVDVSAWHVDRLSDRWSRLLEEPPAPIGADT